MRYLATGIVKWLIRNEAITEEDGELYEYAAYSLLITLAPLFLATVIGCIIGSLTTSIVLILPFMVIRKFSGGFYAKHAWTCLCCSCGLLAVCFLAASEIRFHVWLGIIAICAVFCLIACSPVDSENRRLQPEEKKEYKQKAGRIALGILGMIALLLMLGAEELAVHGAVGLIMAAGLQVPCVLQHVFQIFTGQMKKYTKKG
ncbi:MAG: accessory gene regulator B family protein [Lachnospiraceae bacterium]|nr:accessory gene regulator B family protein [Lachnospiraceae bacterium]